MWSRVAFAGNIACLCHAVRCEEPYSVCCCLSSGVLWRSVTWMYWGKSRNLVCGLWQPTVWSCCIARFGETCCQKFQNGFRTPCTVHAVRYGGWFDGVLQEGTASVFRLGYDTVLPGYIAAFLGYLPTPPYPCESAPSASWMLCWWCENPEPFRKMKSAKQRRTLRLVSCHDGQPRDDPQLSLSFNHVATAASRGSVLLQVYRRSWRVQCPATSV